jgi:hypothetical protein
VLTSGEAHDTTAYTALMEKRDSDLGVLLGDRAYDSDEIRRVATRYDQTGGSFLGFVLLACIRLWIRFVHALWTDPSQGRAPPARITAKDARSDCWIGLPPGLKVEGQGSRQSFSEPDDRRPFGIVALKPKRELS